MNRYVALFFAVLSLPSYLHGNIEKAISTYEKGEYREAIGLLSLLSRESPAAPEVNLWLGKSHLKLREWDHAVREMEKAVKLEPSNPLYHLWLGRAYGLRAAHSIFFTAIRWARRVVKEFETARSLSPRDINIRFDLLEYYLAAPGIVGGGRDKAQAEAQAIAELEPQRGYTARAVIHEKDRNWDLAKKELVQATIDHPRDADTYKDLADFLLDRQDYQGAFATAQKALEFENGSRQARLILAASQTKLGIHLEAAAKRLQELAAGPLGDEDPAFEDVYCWLGVCYLAKGDKDRALGAFKSALRYNPECEKAKNYLAENR
jgi:tetratricopeptide (TPR) repeat protein